MLATQKFEITEQQVMQGSGRPVQFTAEASDLGLKPGQWPTELTMKRDDGTTTEFTFVRRIEHDGDLVAVVYASLGRCELLNIQND
jgi:hypothetical protein